MSDQLNKNVKIEQISLCSPISRTAASLHLLHHQVRRSYKGIRISNSKLTPEQAIILAIRPVLYFLLEKLLASKDQSVTISSAVHGLLRVCIESGLQTLQIAGTLWIHKIFGR